MLKKALKISLIISLFFIAVLAAAAYLTKAKKDELYQTGWSLQSLR